MQRTTVLDAVGGREGSWGADDSAGPENEKDDMSEDDEGSCADAVRKGSEQYMMIVLLNLGFAEEYRTRCLFLPRAKYE